LGDRDRDRDDELSSRARPMARRDRLAVSFAASTLLSRVRRAALFTLRSRRSRDESEPDDRDLDLPRDNGSSSSSKAANALKNSKKLTSRDGPPCAPRSRK